MVTDTCPINYATVLEVFGKQRALHMYTLFSPLSLPSLCMNKPTKPPSLRLDTSKACNKSNGIVFVAAWSCTTIQDCI